MLLYVRYVWFLRYSWGLFLYSWNAKIKYFILNINLFNNINHILSSFNFSFSCQNSSYYALLFAANFLSKPC